MPPADSGRGRTARLVRNVVSTAGSRIVVLGVSFAVTPVLFHGLGLERYGLWAVAGVLVQYVGLMDLGVGNAFVRFFSEAHGRGDGAVFRGVLVSGFLFYAAFAALVVAGAVAGAPAVLAALHAPESLVEEGRTLVWGVAAIFALRQTFGVFRAAVASVERVDLLSHTEWILALPTAALQVFVVLRGDGLAGLVAVGLLAAAAASATYVLLALRVCPALRPPFRRVALPNLGGMLRFGLSVQVTRAAEIVHGQIDKLFLALLLGAAAAGPYDLGMKAALLVGVLPSWILPSLLPTGAVLAGSGDLDTLQRFLGRTSKYVALTVFPGAAWLVVQAGPVLTAWIGPTASLEQARWAALWLGLALAPHLLLGPARLVARAMNRPQCESWGAGVTALVNLGLTPALILALGFSGAPLASAMAGVAGGVVFLAMFRRRMRELRAASVFAAWRTPALGALVAAGTTWIVAGIGLPAWESGRADAAVHAAGAALVFGATYGAVLFAGGAFDAQDRRVADLAAGRLLRRARGREA